MARLARWLLKRAPGAKMVQLNELIFLRAQELVVRQLNDGDVEIHIEANLINW